MTARFCEIRLICALSRSLPQKKKKTKKQNQTSQSLAVNYSADYISKLDVLGRSL